MFHLCLSHWTFSKSSFIFSLDLSCWCTGWGYRWEFIPFT